MTKYTYYFKTIDTYDCVEYHKITISKDLSNSELIAYIYKTYDSVCFQHIVRIITEEEYNNSSNI